MSGEDAGAIDSLALAQARVHDLELCISALQEQRRVAEQREMINVATIAYFRKRLEDAGELV